MGNAAIYWWPEGAKSARTIDLGEGLSDFDDRPDHDMTRRRAYSGRIYTAIHSRRSRVRVVLEKFTSSTLIQELRNLEEHLSRGGWCSVAGDSAKAVAVFRNKGSYRRGQKFLGHKANAWFNQSAALASGDVVQIVSFSTGISQFATITGTWGARRTQLTEGLLTDMAGPLMIRHELFAPHLVLPEGTGTPRLVTHDHRYTWTLDMDLVTDPSSLQRLAGISGAIFGEGGASPDRTLRDSRLPEGLYIPGLNTTKPRS